MGPSVSSSIGLHLMNVNDTIVPLFNSARVLSQFE
jgi:hypothetical protein